jgi:hypothetical protein
MGLAWTADDVGDSVLPERDRAERDRPARPRPGQPRFAGRHTGRPWMGSAWTAGPRHRRPTLLARGGQAVAGRITALAGTDPAPGSPEGSLAHPPRRRTLAARKYWT